MNPALRAQIEEAAAARKDNVRALRDRPTQRRCAEERGALAVVRAKAKIEVREADVQDGQILFDGYASVTGHSYEMWDFFGPYDEQVAPGAFAKTLGAADLDVPLVLAHDSLRRVARTTNGTLDLTEDDHGLHTVGRLDATDHDVAYILPKLRSGLIDEMSFKFRITQGSWSPDWMEYHIEEVDIHRGDVAIVGYGANPATAGSGVRNAPAAPTRSRVVFDDDDTRVRKAH